MRKLAVFGLLGSIALLGLWAFNSEARRILAGRWSFTRSVEVDRGTYFRLKVKLTYKGEAADFDLVVGCNVRQTNYKDGSRTYEAGLVPTVFGKRMPDGKGLVVRPPNACGGETTANGRVMSDLLPVVVVYDDANTLAFGTAYLSEDAYQSSLSLLKFGGATIEAADRKAFDEFRRTQPNLVTREAFHSSKGASAEVEGLKRVYPSLGMWCTGFARYTIPERLKPLIRKHWPADKPRYWKPGGTYQEAREALYILAGKDIVRSDRPDEPLRAKELFPLPDVSIDDIGLPTHAGGGRVYPERMRGRAFPSAIYPSLSDHASVRWVLSEADIRREFERTEAFVGWDIEVRQGTKRGFAYCWSIYAISDGSLAGSIQSKMTITRVDGEEALPRLHVGERSNIIYEKDEYIFINFNVSLDSTRGDV